MTKEAKFKTLRANELACTWGIRTGLHLGHQKHALPFS